MKIGKRKQQGRKENSKQKEECPECHEEYLESLFTRKTSIESYKKTGVYCPNCGYSRVDLK